MLLVATGMLAFEGGSNIIKPDGSLVVILILFLFFVFVMNRLLFRPIGHVLDQRQRKTEGARHEARAAVRVYQGKAAEYEFSIRQTRAETYRLLQQARERALAERARALEAARQAAAREIDAARAELEREAATARTTLEKDARQIAADISRNLLGRPVLGGAD
jgi:F-type H+-transporting ATPase subunit b